MPITIPFSDWTPDKPAFRTVESLQVAKNIWPRADGRDRPVNAPQERVGSNNRTPQNTVVTTWEGTERVFMASATSLWEVVGTAWSERTRTVGGAYSNASQGWDFAEFGDRLFASNGVDPLQSLLLTGGAGSFADVAGAPSFGCLGVVEPGFLMGGDFLHGTDGAAPAGVWWSAIENGTDWPYPLGTSAADAKQSSNQRFPTGGRVMQILGAVGGYSAVIFSERTIRRCQYVGPPAIFAFEEVERSRGLAARMAAVTDGPFAYFLSAEGFFVFDGQSSKPIGAGRVDQFFWREVNRSFLHRVHAVLDPLARNIIWSFPSTRSQDGTCDMALVYNTNASRWRLLDSPRLTCSMWGLGGTADASMDVDLGGDDDLLDSDGSLDSGTSQPTQLALFTQDGAMHTLSGETLEGIYETAELDLGTSALRQWVSGVIPVVDTPEVRAHVGMRDTQADSPTYSDETGMEPDGVCPATVGGSGGVSTRYLRVRVRIPQGASWRDASGVEVINGVEGFR